MFRKSIGIKVFLIGQSQELHLFWPKLHIHIRFVGLILQIWKYTSELLPGFEKYIIMVIIVNDAPVARQKLGYLSDRNHNSNRTIEVTNIDIWKMW